MRLLVVNAGSSSVKLRVLGSDDRLLKAADLPARSVEPLGEALEAFLAEAPSVDVVGHRVVHGGSAFPGPVRVDEATDERLERLTDLAPLHNPASVAGIRALRRLRPALAQVACFDTSFHASMPAASSTYAIPRAWTERWGLRRYGFHGLSHAWASRRAAELFGRPLAELRLVTAHLGSGASLAAVAAGRSVDTTMGFTPLEGLVMATRSGSVDPGLVLWLQRHGGQLRRSSGVWSMKAGFSACAERRISARSWARLMQAKPARALPTVSTCTGCASRSPGWRRRWVGWMGWCSPAAPGRARLGCGVTRAWGLASLASSWTTSRTSGKRHPTG